MRISIRTLKFGRSSSRLERTLPAELWQIVAEYLSGHELQNAAFLHPSLSDLAKTFKYREARIDLSFFAHNGHGSDARDSLKTLSRLRSTGNAHRIQILRIGHCNVSAAKHWILKVFGEQISDRLFLANPWQASPSILRDFAGIKSLYVDTSFNDLWQVAQNDSSSGLQHPFMSWIWEHVGTRLTTLSLMMPPIMPVLLRIFPDKADLSGLLPALQVMELTLIFTDIKEPDKVLSQRPKAIRCITTFYLRSASLKGLTIKGFNFDSLMLSILLPLEADAFPSLESFSFQDVASYSKPVWIEPVGKFIGLHAEKLKVLRLSGRLIYRTEQNITRWPISIPLPGLVTLELYHVLQVSTPTDIADILHPPILIAQSLKCLTFILESGRFGNIIPEISAAAPHLESLHIRNLAILSTDSVVLLAHHFPNLYTLCLEFYGFWTWQVSPEFSNDVNYTPDSFINDLRRTKEDDLLNWKLFDISLIWIAHEKKIYDRSVHINLLKAFAAQIPSIESFHGEGDKFGSFTSPLICSCTRT